MKYAFAPRDNARPDTKFSIAITKLRGDHSRTRAILHANIKFTCQCARVIGDTGLFDNRGPHPVEPFLGWGSCPRCAGAPTRWGYLSEER